MQYGEMIEGIFISRPNRFVAKVLAEGGEVTCHVKNTGRCRELLVPGVRVWLQRENGEGRKTAYSLITVEKGDLLVNLDSQAPNRVAYEWMLANRNPELICRERTYGNSRFDLYIEKDGKKCYIEVKGVHLFRPNVRTQPEFGEALRRAKQAGVEILAYDCSVTENSLKMDRQIAVSLEDL